MNSTAYHLKSPSFLPSVQNQRQPSPARSTMAGPVAVALAVLAAVMVAADAGDENRVFQPCADAKVKRYDGFTFGIAFASRDSFFFNQIQLSPCDQRLSLSSNNAQLAVFRPKVDEISLLTINTTTSPSEQPLQINTVITHEDQLPQEIHIVGLLSVYKDMVTSGGFMVAFAGRKYAARSLPTFVGNSSYSVTSFTLVLEFQKGTLQNLYWKRDGCSSCSGNSNFVCLNKQECAIKTSSCKGQSQGGSVDCSIGIQTAFSGTDKHEVALNSWYEVSNLRQYSLYGLYSNLKGSLTSQYNNFF